LFPYFPIIVKGMSVRKSTLLFNRTIELLVTTLVFVLIASCSKSNKKGELVKDSLEENKSKTVLSAPISSEDPDRDIWQRPEKVIAKMGDLKGKTVVDIGAGTGYFTFQLAEKADKVIATDIESSFLEYIIERKQEYYPQLDSKIITRLTQPDDPFIAPQEADWVLLVNTYHYIPDKIQYLSKVRKGLRPNGSLLLVDYKQQPSGKLKTEIPVVSITEVASNLSASGFTRITVDDTTLPYQYIITAFF